MPRESCEPILNKTSIHTSRAIRNNYFPGKQMYAKDLILEQSYFIEKIRRMNREISGYGIVNGLTISEFNASKKELELNPGIAVDSHGNLLTLYQKTLFSLSKKLEDGDYIYLKFLEKGQNRVLREDDETCGTECCFNHIAEEMEIVLDKQFLDIEVNNVCHRVKEKKIQHQLAYLRGKEPFLLLGQYYVSKDGKGNIDNKKRVKLHSNSELSKLLCDIEHHHVRSVNGSFGDVSALSRINGEKPTATGEFEILAGNNITVKSDKHQVTIGTKNGFHKEYFLTFAKAQKIEISHDRGVFPMVDIYRRVTKVLRDKEIHTAVLKKDLRIEAKALNVDFNHFLTMNNAKTIEDSIGREEFKKNNAKSKVSTVLKKANIEIPSYGVLNIIDKPIMYYPEDIYVLPQYSYEKIVGRVSEIDVKVTHIDRKTLEIENLSSSEIHLMIVLNT